jgi:hypothetical protein
VKPLLKCSNERRVMKMTDSAAEETWCGRKLSSTLLPPVHGGMTPGSVAELADEV